VLASAQLGLAGPSHNSGPRQRRSPRTASENSAAVQTRG